MPDPIEINPQCPPLKDFSEKEGSRIISEWRNADSKILEQGLSRLNDEDTEVILDLVIPLTDDAISEMSIKGEKIRFITGRIKKALENSLTTSPETKKDIVDILLFLYEKGIGCKSST